MNVAKYLAWLRRPTVRWQKLSSAARGVLISIVMAFNDRGELSLGGEEISAALPLVMARPWSEIEPALSELTRARFLFHDVDRGVLFDPEHVLRQTEARAETMRSEPLPPYDRPRPVSMTPDAVRARARRASTRPDAIAGSPTPVATAVATAVATTVVSSSYPPPVNIKSKGRQERPVGIAHDPDVFPTWALDAFRRCTRPDVTEHVARRVWWRFARVNPTHKSEADAADHYGRWLAKERVEATAAAHPPPATQSAPETPAPREDEPIAEAPPEPDPRPCIPPPRAEHDAIEAKAAAAEFRRMLSTLDFTKFGGKDLARAALREIAPPEPRSLSA